MATVKYLDENGLSTVWSKVKGIVTPKADKVSGATNGHLAGLNSSGNLTDSGLPASNIAQKDGSYSGMTVGAAEDLVSAESVASEFTSRITGGSTAVGKGGTALVDKIKGRTLVWNQLVKNPNFASNSLTDWNFNASLTFSFDNRVLTITGINGSLYLSQEQGITLGHKYYVSMKVGFYDSTVSSTLYNLFVFYGSNGVQTVFQAPVANSLDKYSAVITADKGGSQFGFSTYPIPPGATLKIDCDYGINIIDLTLMFGAGNEPSTVAEFEALYPGPFYDYNTGTLISNAATAIETVGWNQWDEEWEDGFYDSTNGTKKAQANTWRNKTPVRILPNTTYYATYTLYRWYYDADMNFIQYTGDGLALFTSPSNAYYLNFGQSAEPNGPTSSVCISLSDPSRNGTYEPYWRSELELGLGDIKVKSHNLWDEEYENGDGVWNYIMSKNYCDCKPNTTYYLHCGTYTNMYYLAMYFYDENKVQISYTYACATTVTSPANARYFKVKTNSQTYVYGNQYLNDICVNESDPAFNGRYEPYGDGGVISITGGLKSAGTVYDEISGNKLVKRIESVDMGSMTWNRESTYGRFLAPVDEIRPAISNSVPSNIVCAKYKLIDLSTMLANQPDKTLAGTETNTNVCILDSAYSDAATFQASLAGVPLYYELAQPIEYELAEAIPTAMRNDPYGTERRLPEDTAAIVTAPFRADITYSTNIKEAVQSMHQNFINVNSMQDFLAELGTLMGGTWTMRPADGKFDFTFTPNPVEPTL